MSNPSITRSILAARDVTKAFGPVTVLHDIQIDFCVGEIHAIVGENGAGKSILMKILSGVLKPSLGEVLYEGNPVETGNLRAMENFGVRLIHQELNLAEDLSVLENLFLGEERTWGPFLDEAKMRAKGREVLAKVGSDIDLDTPVRNLRVSEKQLMEIAKAISQRVTVLILDEPTASLTQHETERLFQIVESFSAPLHREVADQRDLHSRFAAGHAGERIAILFPGFAVLGRAFTVRCSLAFGYLAAQSGHR